MSDLEQRLRDWADTGDFGRGPNPSDLRRQAADQLERYREALEGAREAIENQDECEAIAIIRTALKETTDGG